MYAAAAPVPGVNSPQQALVRVDTASGRVAAWHAGAHTYVGEPILVPNAQRRAGGAFSFPCQACMGVPVLGVVAQGPGGGAGSLSMKVARISAAVL